jgi:CubicO group peptidase (beta-lactamase class C family)
MRQHSDDRVPAVVPADSLATQLIRMADDAITVRQLLSHTGGVDNPAELYADTVPDLAALMGPVIGCGRPRGVPSPSNGGYAVLGQLIADVTEMPYPAAATRLVLDPLGLRDCPFPEDPVGRGPNAVTCYTVTGQGTFVPFPAKVYTLPAVAGLWATGADLIRLATGWSSLLPPSLAREALTARSVTVESIDDRLSRSWINSGSTARSAQERKTCTSPIPAAPRCRKPPARPCPTRCGTRPRSCTSARPPASSASSSTS